MYIKELEAVPFLNGECTKYSSLVRSYMRKCGRKNELKLYGVFFKYDLAGLLAVTIDQNGTCWIKNIFMKGKYRGCHMGEYLLYQTVKSLYSQGIRDFKAEFDDRRKKVIVRLLAACKFYKNEQNLYSWQSEY